MGQSIRALIQLAAIAFPLVGLGLIFAGPVGWIAKLIGVALLVLSVACIAILIWAGRRRDKFPDLLARVSRAYFECDGLCFAPVFDVVDAKCRMNLFYQNRYRNGCTCDVQIDPPQRSFWIGRIAMPALRLRVECGGGEFGVVRCLYAVPAKRQGKRLTFDVGARTIYPDGAGELLRFREGLRVRAAKGNTGTLLTLLAACVGIVYLRGSAKFTVVLPKPVAEELSIAVAAQSETLWIPEFPTHGFPVVMPSEAAARTDVSTDGTGDQ